MPKQRIDREAVVTSAIALADQEGLEQVGLGRVAEDLGVAASALYNHVDGVDGLRHDLAVQATMNLANALRDAAVARAGADALRSIARAYRSFAVDHPGQYASSLLPPSGTEDSLVASHQAILQLFVQVLAAFDISGDDAVHAARTIRSAVHGFVSLEAIDALTLHQPSDESFDHLVEMLVSAVQS